MSFLRVIAFMSQEFWPGLSENVFGRKLSFKLYETWYFWGVKLFDINFIIFLYPALACPQKTYVPEIWSRIKTRHFSPLLTRLWFSFKRRPSTASTRARWMLGGGFTTFGIKAAGVDSMWSLLCQVHFQYWKRPSHCDYGVTSQFVTRVYTPGSFLGYISHSRSPLK